MKSLSYVIFVTIFALAIVAGCAEDRSRTPFHLDGEAQAVEEPVRTYTFENGLVVEVPEPVTQQPGWPDALREIDTAWRSFTWSYGAFPPVRLIHFHGTVHPINADGERAEYLGDGLIHACYHLRLPHTFCLPEAFAAACRAEPTPGKTEADIDRATQVSQSWVGAIYGLTDRID